MDYELTGKHGNKKGEFYIELMRLEIEWEKKELEASWQELEVSFLGELPSNKPALPNTPTMEEWASSQKNAGWVFVKKGVYRSPRKTPVSAIKIAARINSSPKTEFIYNHYDSFSSEFQGWFDYKNKLLIWKMQLRDLSAISFDFDFLDYEGLSYTEGIFLSVGFNPKSLSRDMLRGFNMFGRTKFTSGCFLSTWLVRNAPEVELFSRNPNFQQNLISKKIVKNWLLDHKICKSSKSSRTKNAISTNLEKNADRNEKIVLMFNELCQNEKTSHLSKQAKASNIKIKLRLNITTKAIINVFNKAE